MRHVLLIFATILGWQQVAAAQQADYFAGYRDCSLRNLSACQNSNQLFSGPPSATNQIQKTDFTDALAAFLRDAPTIETAGQRFTASDVAQESLIGPGNAPTRFATGEIFLDGFTPHYAFNRGAVIATPTGDIKVVATLSSPDSNAPRTLDLRRHLLRVYAHELEPKTEWIEHLQAWAKSAIDTFGPDQAFGGTELLIADGRQHWQSRLLP
jgi:hypothetical protein